MGQEQMAQVMLYGELVVSNKHDYHKADIFQKWLCFGAALRPVAEGDAPCERLANQLRAAGYNACQKERCVMLSLNMKLLALLCKLGVNTVATGYQPTRGA